MRRSIELPDREVELPGRRRPAAARKESRYRSRSGPTGVAYVNAIARAELQIADGRVEAVERDLSGVEEDRAADRSPDLVAKLDRRLDERLAADRIVGAIARTEAPASVAANALLAAGIETLEERQILFGADRIGEGELGAAGENRLPDEWADTSSPRLRSCRSRKSPPGPASSNARETTSPRLRIQRVGRGIPARAERGPNSERPLFTWPPSALTVA